MSLNMNHNTNCACDEHVVAVPTEVLQIGAASAGAASAVQSSEPKWTLGTGGPECSPGCRCIWGGRCSDREPREIFGTPFLGGGGGDATPFLGGGGDATPSLGGGDATPSLGGGDATPHHLGTNPTGVVEKSIADTVIIVVEMVVLSSMHQVM